MTNWTTPDGRRLTVEEDEPGVVKVTTEALGELLRLAGMTEVVEPIKGTAVQGITQVLRDEHGRCQECGSAPSEHHRENCPHFRGQRADPWPSSFETRPLPKFGEERR